MDVVMVANEELKFRYSRATDGKANPCDGYEHGHCNVYDRPCDGCYQASKETMRMILGE